MNEKQETNNSNKSGGETPGETPNRAIIFLSRLFLRHPRLVIIGWSLAIILFILILPLAYFSWFVAIPGVVDWAKDAYWHWFLAIFALLFLGVIPIWGAMGAVAYANLMLTTQETIHGTKMDAALAPAREAEKRLLESPLDEDPARLLPLLAYSAEHLQAYYKLGLRQARWSFFISVIAMLVGFLFLLGGFVITSLDPSILLKLNLSRPQNTQDIRLVIIAGGAIIEFVSALFLWVYRSSIGQLTYFYSRQIHTHNVVLCYRIAASMKEPDEAKRIIVEKVIERTWMPERIEPTGAKWFRRFIPGGG